MRAVEFLPHGSGGTRGTHGHVESIVISGHCFNIERFHIKVLASEDKCRRSPAGVGYRMLFGSGASLSRPTRAGTYDMRSGSPSPEMKAPRRAAHNRGEGRERKSLWVAGGSQQARGKRPEGRCYTIAPEWPSSPFRRQSVVLRAGVVFEPTSFKGHNMSKVDFAPIGERVLVQVVIGCERMSIDDAPRLRQCIVLDPGSITMVATDDCVFCAPESLRMIRDDVAIVDADKILAKGRPSSSDA